MISISKYDKKIWDTYVSNFEKFTLVENKKNLYDSKKKNFGFKKKNSSNFNRLLKKGKIKPDSVIDLHGYKQHEGKLFLQKHIINCYDNNIRNVLVITGKGHKNKGVLKKEVPSWLNDEFLKKILVDFDVAPKNFGGEGALLVRIKNKYKANGN